MMMVVVLRAASDVHKSVATLRAALLFVNRGRHVRIPLEVIGPARSSQRAARSAQTTTLPFCALPTARLPCAGNSLDKNPGTLPGSGRACDRDARFATRRTQTVRRLAQSTMNR